MVTFPMSHPDGRAMWLRRLATAFRTALACSVVACVTLYGPAPLRRQVAFPAFSYLTAILIVTNAALGDAVRGCCLALVATVQTVCPAMFLFWFIGPTKFCHITTALTVSLASVVVVVPSYTHVLAKKIALGQIVLIYVVGFIGGVQTDPVMHPIHVAATTALGAAASVCATLLPFPRLATLQVKEKSKEVVENMVERVRLMVKAVLSNDDSAAAAYLSKARLLSSSTTKLLLSIQFYKESKQWERLPLKIFKLGWLSNSTKKLEDLELTLNGMELALSRIPSYPIQNQQQSLKQDLNTLNNQITNALNQPNISSDSIPTIKSIQIMPKDPKDLPHLFFIFCIKLLITKSQIKTSTKIQETKTRVSSTNTQRLIPPLKFAISMGFAAFLGLMYNNENGFWACLAVAVSIASDREPTFKVANVKLHGTMLGSVYGILSFLLFEKFLICRLISLLPWFLFTSFLNHSRMYGSAGGVAAVVGALVVLGRTNYGAPEDFAFTRTIETFIGISISVIVDIIFHPKRASKLAKIQLNSCFQTLQICIDSLSFRTNIADCETKQRDLKNQVNELKKLIDEAEIEPKFWFLPFHRNSYLKLLKSLSKTVDLFGFIIDATSNLKQNISITEENLEHEVLRFKEMAKDEIKYCEDLNSLKFVRVVEKKLKKKENCDDLEMGEKQRIETEEMELVDSFLQRCVEVVTVTEWGESKNGKSEVILSLSAVGFCLSGLIREIEEIGVVTRELIQCENPSWSSVDFKAIVASRICIVQK